MLSLAGTFRSSFSRAILLTAMVSVAGGCAYRWGNASRSLPGGYSHVYIPMFRNLSMEPGAEVVFTNQLKTNFERSKVARVSEQAQAEVVLEGVIRSIAVNPSPAAGFESQLLTQVVLSKQYDIKIQMDLTLRRISDGKVLWSGEFNSKGSYVAGTVQQPVINTVNPLYNLSARKKSVDDLASGMMAEAHDRISENF